MNKTIDYYLSLISPWSYLGHQRLQDIATRHQATIKLWPVDFALIFPSTGGVPLPRRSTQRQAYRMQELQRWRDYLDLPLTLEPKHFPVSDKLAACVVIAAQEMGSDVGPLCHGFLKAVWAEERDISDPDTVAAIADENDLDGKLLVAAAENPALADTWERNTDAAIAAGVMGAPFFIIGDEKLWGQDRLEFVDRILGGEVF